MNRPAVFGLVLCSLGATAIAQAQYAHFVAHSENGDPIGLGQDYDRVFTPEHSLQFFAGGDNYTQGNPAFITFNFVLPDFSKELNLSFNSSGLGAPLGLGTYSDALPITTVVDGHPNMEIVLDGRQPDTLTGSFTITEFNYLYNPVTGWNDIIDFEGTFVQYANGSNAALTGTFSFHQEGAPVPEPASMGALGLGCAALAARRRKRSEAPQRSTLNAPREARQGCHQNPP